MLVEEMVAAVPPQLQEVVSLAVPQEGLEGQAEAALEEFKRLHRSKFPVCEQLMLRGTSRNWRLWATR